MISELRHAQEISDAQEKLKELFAIIAEYERKVSESEEKAECAKR